MKKALAISVLIISLIVVGIPLLVFRGYSHYSEELSDQGPNVRILDKGSGRTKDIPLEEYLVGVLAAEMPAEFELEALKAQAIAARTYTARRMFTFGAKPNDVHPGSEVCTDPVHCQAWISQEEMKSKWGRVRYYLYIEKIRKAVEHTRGLVIVYNNEMIDPVYHGSCGGKGTENSEDVWVSGLPYLKGVDCSHEYRGAEQVYKYEIDKSAIISAFKSEGLVLNDDKERHQLIDSVVKSQRNRVLRARVLGQEITGGELRRVLGLTSTYLEWKFDGDKVIFTSIGKGHAVGLCQYGANDMAKAGHSCKEILLHYYSAVRIKKI